MIKEKKVIGRVIRSAVLFVMLAFWSGVFAAEKHPGPGFDCKKASTKIETAICNSSILSDRDRRLSILYRAHVSMSENRGSIRESQRKWLRTRQEKCGLSQTQSSMKVCLMTAYKKRWRELYELGGPALEIIGYSISKGSQYELCRHYVDLMNRVESSPKSSCDLPYSFDGVAKQQGFSEIQWEEINKSEHKDALRFYWKTWMKVSDEDMESEENKKAYSSFFAKTKHLWRSILDLNFDGQDEVVYRFPVGGECDYYQYVHFVEGDDIPPKYIDNSRITRELFLYNGRSYSFYGVPGSNRQGVNEIYGEGFSLRERYICEFKMSVD